MDNVNRDYYEVIGLPRDASQNEVDAACYGLAEKYRPENNPGDLLAAKNFALIDEVYETLGSPSRRATYDISLRSTPDAVDLSAAMIANVSARTPALAPQTDQVKLIALGLIGTSLLLFGLVLGLLAIFASEGSSPLKLWAIVGAAIGASFPILVVAGRVGAKKQYRESLQRFETDPTNPNLRKETIERGRKYSNLTRNLFGATEFGEDALMNDINEISAHASIVKAHQPQVNGLAAATSRADQRTTRLRVGIAYAVVILISIAILFSGLALLNRAPSVTVADYVADKTAIRLKDGPVECDYYAVWLWNKKVSGFDSDKLVASAKRAGTCVGLPDAVPLGDITCKDFAVLMDKDTILSKAEKVEVFDTYKREGKCK